METTTQVRVFSSEAEFNEAVDKVREASAAYHNTDTLVLTDAEYDALMEQIEVTLAVNPTWDDKGVTTQVAAGAAAPGDIKHKTKMLSLGKSKKIEDVEAFVSGLNGEPVVVEVKLDGLALSAQYDNGVLKVAGLRGGGDSGEDVTVNARRGIKGLPARLDTPWTGEVRGEVYMTDEDFDTASEERVARGKNGFANPRNAVAGSIRKERDFEVPMSFGAYDINGQTADDLDSYAARVAFAATLGFGTAAALLTPEESTPKDNPAAVREVIEAIEARRGRLGFPIDGAVIKVDSYMARERLGSTSSAPRSATAFKYPADTAVTKMIGIEIRPGRTGRLGFRAVLEPVFVGGTTVNYASLHNGPWLLAHDLRVGDTTWVWRAGDVIPRITTADLEKRPSDSQPWPGLETCPVCDEPLDKTSKLWRCHTPSCSVAGSLEFWAGSDALDIDGIGETICVALAETGLATNVADLYDLTVEQWAGLTLSNGSVLGTANAAKIVANLDKSKQQPFNRVITGLGIRMTGRSVGRWLASEFKTMDALRAATVEQIAEIDKMGEKKATSVVNGLERLSEVIDRLAAHGLAMEVVETGGAKPLEGEKVVVSGTVPGLTRTEAQEAVGHMGGSASGSPSKNTTVFVQGEGAGSKAEKVAKFNEAKKAAGETLIKIMTGQEFADLYAASKA